MSTNHLDLAAIRAWTESLVEDAAQMALDMLDDGAMNKRQKADGSTVTDIDQTVERFLRQAIEGHFPGHAILGEEYGHAAVSGDPNAPLWALDPIDGTTNLANGLPQWGVSVGLVSSGEPIIGVVAFPILGETYSAAKGLGATVNGEPLPRLEPGGPTDWEDTYATCSSTARSMDFSPVAARLRVLGSAALEVCWVSAGKLKGCQSIGVSLYDVAGGACVAGEVGAELGWLSGRAWSAGDMAQTGPTEADVLVCAPPATLDFLRDRLKLQSGAV